MPILTAAVDYRLEYEQAKLLERLAKRRLRAAPTEQNRTACEDAKAVRQAAAFNVAQLPRS